MTSINDHMQEKLPSLLNPYIGQQPVSINARLDYDSVSMVPALRFTITHATKQRPQALHAVLSVYERHPDARGRMVTLEGGCDQPELFDRMILYSFDLANEIGATNVDVTSADPLAILATDKWVKTCWLRPVYTGTETSKWQATDLEPMTSYQRK